MNRKFLAFLVAMGCIASVSRADAAEPQEIVDQYLESLISGDPEKGFNRLMQNSKLDELKPADISLVSSRVSELLKFYGKPVGFEPVEAKLYGKSLKRLLYLTTHRYVPVVWQFDFYHVDDAWELINIQMSDRHELLK